MGIENMDGLKPLEDDVLGKVAGGEMPPELIPVDLMADGEPEYGNDIMDVSAHNENHHGIPREKPGPLNSILR